MRDFDRMVTFYREAFGFELARLIDTDAVAAKAGHDGGTRTSRPRAAMLHAGNCYVELIELAGEEPVRSDAVHFSIEVQDIEREFGRLGRLGVVFSHPAPFDLGYVKAAKGLDPEGNAIEISEYAPASGRSISQIFDR